MIYALTNANGEYFVYKHPLNGMRWHPDLNLARGYSSLKGAKIAAGIYRNSTVQQIIVKPIDAPRVAA